MLKKCVSVILSTRFRHISKNGAFLYGGWCVTVSSDIVLAAAGGGGVQFV